MEGNLFFNTPDSENSALGAVHCLAIKREEKAEIVFTIFKLI